MRQAATKESLQKFRSNISQFSSSSISWVESPAEDLIRFCETGVFVPLRVLVDDNFRLLVSREGAPLTLDRDRCIEPKDFRVVGEFVALRVP